MKAAARNVLIVVTVSVVGLLLAMNLRPSTVIDSGTASPAGIPINLASISPSAELVSSVDWSKIKQEPMSPTF